MGLSGVGRGLGILASMALLGILISQPAAAYPRPGRTERVSVAGDGNEGDASDTPPDGWTGPAISGGGRLVAFESDFTTLVPGDTNGVRDVFVHDRLARTTEVVSVTAGGTPLDGPSRAPSISADGRYVAFETRAENLPGGEPGQVDVYVRDRVGGTTEHVATGSEPSMSADGRYVAMTIGLRVYVVDRVSGGREVVSVQTGGAPAEALSLMPSISADGRYVAFVSAEFRLDADDGNGLGGDVFVHDRVTGRTELVSRSTEGQGGNRDSQLPSISGDGRYVAFRSEAALAPEDTNGDWDVYVRDLVAGATERVSVWSDGQQTVPGYPNGTAPPAISGDGRHVAFSTASALVPEDFNGYWDVYVRDRGPGVGVGGVAATAGGEAVAASGWATFSGTPLASAPDLRGDFAAAPGGDLWRADLLHRPEQEDLLVRLRLTTMGGVRGREVGVFSVAGAGAAPGILYVVELTAGSARYEVRASGLAHQVTLPAPRYALFRCDAGCVEVARLAGSVGTTGPDVLVSVPHAVLGTGPGSPLTGIRAYTAVGELETGSQRVLDVVALPDVSIPRASVELGIAPAGAGEDGVAFDVVAGLERGTFAGSIGTGGLSPGDYEVWARACLGAECGPARVLTRIP